MASKIITAMLTDEESREAFCKDIGHVVKLSEDQIRAITDNMISSTEHATRDERQKHSDILFERTQLPPEAMTAASRFIAFIIKYYIDTSFQEKEPPEAIVQEIIDNKIVTADSYDDLLSVIEQAMSECEAIRTAGRKRETAVGLFPSLSSVGHTVEMRLVASRSYAYPQDVDAFEPEVIGITPVLSLRLGYGSPGRDTEYVTIQMVDHELDLLLNNLQAAGKLLKKASSMASVQMREE